VKRLAAVLWSDALALAEARDALQSLWGPVDFEGADHAFDVTDYYRAEMGGGLQRRLLAFRPLAPPEGLPDWKHAARRIEEGLERGGRRRVNIDPGYLDHHKLVLASVKPAGTKIYLERGVYADMLLRFHRGAWSALEWTFADFRDGRYFEELSALRERYLDQLRAAGER
jgi:hypothetical protein